MPEGAIIRTELCQLGSRCQLQVQIADCVNKPRDEVHYITTERLFFRRQLFKTLIVQYIIDYNKASI